MTPFPTFEHVAQLYLCRGRTPLAAMMRPRGWSHATVRPTWVVSWTNVQTYALDEASWVQAVRMIVPRWAGSGVGITSLLRVIELSTCNALSVRQESLTHRRSQGYGNQFHPAAKGRLQSCLAESPQRRIAVAHSCLARMYSKIYAKRTALRNSGGFS